MNIVIPMAGAGSRFASAGYTLPKPLIPAFGKPMYAWAVESLPYAQAQRLIFICLKEHLERFPLEADIRGRYPGVKVEVVALDRLTSGQAETVLAALKWIDNDSPLLIFNADTYVPDPFVMPEGPLDGVIQTFQASDPRYSFARLGEDGWVCEVAEKVPISQHASTGLYYFARGRDFVHYTQKFMAAGRTIQGEAYVMLTYDEMLKEHKRLRIQEVSSHWVLGTPEELERFLRDYRPSKETLASS